MLGARKPLHRIPHFAVISPFVNSPSPQMCALGSIGDSHARGVAGPMSVLNAMATIPSSDAHRGGGVTREAETIPVGLMNSGAPTLAPGTPATGGTLMDGGTRVPRITVNPGDEVMGVTRGTEVTTPVRVNVLDAYLAGYDPDLREMLVDGFRHGFRLGCLDKPRSIFSKNLKSADEFPDVITQKLAKELGLGRIVGPFDNPPFQDYFHVSPIGVVPKHKPNTYRLIHHLSYPKGNSVNDFIPPEQSTVKYASVQDAISVIGDMDDPIYLAKFDVLEAFRNLPVNPRDHPLLGIQWQGKYYYDTCLPMGSSSSCFLFESFSTALKWIAQSKFGIKNIVKVLDDFLFIARTREVCFQNLTKFMALCERLGVPAAPEKIEGPAQVLTFLGVELDTVVKEARLPSGKLNKCQEEIARLLDKKSAYLKEVQSVQGLLSWACQVVLPGRAFLRRLIDLTIGVSKPYHHIRLSRETKRDLELWQKFLVNYNGKSMFHDKGWLTSDQLLLFTDSSGSWGFGATYKEQYFWGVWPHTWLNLNIMILEFVPIVAAVHVWGHRWKNKRVLFMTDNMALMAAINKQSSKDKKIMYLMRLLVLKCLELNMIFHASFVPTLQNGRADALSRGDLQRFRRLHPNAEAKPVPIPQEVLPRNLNGVLEAC